MAVDPRSRGRWWSRLHFLVRFLGLTGLVVGGIGLFLVLIEARSIEAALTDAWEKVLPVVQGQEDVARLSLEVGLLAGGIVAGLFALLIEVIAVLGLVSGRRSAVGFNAVVQLALAAVLLLGINIYAFQHYERFDWTWEQKFTLDQKTKEQLAQLDRRTTVVIFLRHKSFGQLSDKPDAYDSAAERKVIEKVNDLAELFQEFGPQFKIEVLDVEGEHYNTRRKDVTRALAEEALRSQNLPTSEKAVADKAREMRKTIEAVPDNSVFFFAGDHVQRLSFDELYYLDKVASRNRSSTLKKDDEDEDRGTNLVLLDQGTQPFARQVLHMDQKRPRVGVLTIHEELTTESGREEIGMQGLKKALTSHGFDVQDVILKRPNRVRGGLEAAAYTFEEFLLDKLDNQLVKFKRDKVIYERLKEVLIDQRKQIAEVSIAKLTKEDGSPVTEKDRQMAIAIRSQRIDDLDNALKDLDKKQESVEKQRKDLDVDRITEEQRMSDLKAKLTSKLSECDLIIIPRLTVLNIIQSEAIPGYYHKLDPWQVDVIRDYLKAGKPMLACFGSDKDTPPSPFRRPPPPTRPDGLDTLLADLGVRLGPQVVIFEAEAEKMEERSSDQMITLGKVEVPSVEFNWHPGALQASKTKDVLPDEKPGRNPLRHSMEVVVHRAGSEFRLPPHSPQRVSLDPEKAKKLPYPAEFMATNERAWAEDDPFPGDGSPPSAKEKPRGPFPIGLAYETKLPESWYKDSKDKPAQVRLVVIGDGALFVGKELSPTQERLLLNTCNWLLGRDDQLPRDSKRWSFPRVELSQRERDIWKWSAWLGLPALFAYLGLVVLLVRRLR